MSRVVAMLTGDIEVSEVKSRPGYLTDWHFNDLSSNFASCGPAEPIISGSENERFSTVSSTSMVHNVGSSASPTQPMLEVIGDGRISYQGGTCGNFLLDCQKVM
ncbi:hypothetical protein B296_00003058 [Ensete ventricosum]|uniref:Uncharacterized protein n=1 Tax=Ensete ventricosum TaxID=4639 RepID=A0A427A1M4_ENSVE|nr:hypothetical protein B296_00003058 [Ensete ventricosum]